MYSVLWFLSLFSVFCDLSGDKNIWFLFLVVVGISSWVYTLEGSNIGYSICLFISGIFMLFRSASVWKFAAG